MNQLALTLELADRTGMSQAQAEVAILTLVDIIKESVSDGHEVKIKGFGTFLAKKHKPRSGYDCSTKQTIKIPATWRPKFRYSPEFKDLLKCLK